MYDAGLARAVGASAGMRRARCTRRAGVSTVPCRCPGVRAPGIGDKPAGAPQRRARHGFGAPPAALASVAADIPAVTAKRMAALIDIAKGSTAERGTKAV